jgi:hypothetical protein
MFDASDCKHLHSELPAMVPTVAQRWLQFWRSGKTENLAEDAAEEAQRLLCCLDARVLMQLGRSQIGSLQKFFSRSLLAHKHGPG